MKSEINNKIEDGLYDFYLQADSQTIRDSLKADLQNFEDYERKKKQLLFLMKARLNKSHNEHLLQLAAKFQEAIHQNIEKPISFLKELLRGNTSPALYNNLDKLSKEDIIEMIKDQNLVDLLETLDVKGDAQQG